MASWRRKNLSLLLPPSAGPFCEIRVRPRMGCPIGLYVGTHCAGTEGSDLPTTADLTATTTTTQAPGWLKARHDPSLNPTAVFDGPEVSDQIKSFAEEQMKARQPFILILQCTLIM